MGDAPKANRDPAVPSEEEIVGRAKALVPMLRARADEVERNRGVPPETIEEFRKAGFFKILQPACFGGWEMNPVVFYKVLMELGRGCCSSAWNMMILGIHQWEFGLFPKGAGEEVWGRDNTVLVGSSYAPWGKAERVDGGYVLNGTWRTSSGCDHASWSILGALVELPDGSMDHRSFLVGGKDYTINDDWYTFGLAGTGSRSLIVKDAFVPDYRHHSVVDYEYSDRPEPYLLPFNMAFFFAVSAVVAGFGQGAIDLYMEEMKERKTVVGGAMKASPYVKDRLGNAIVKVRSARARLLEDMREATGFISRRELVPMDLRVSYLLDGVHVGRDVEEAALLVYKATSARGIFLSNPLQRVVRDILAAANHISMNADDNTGLAGGFFLGEEVPPGFLKKAQKAAAE